MNVKIETILSVSNLEELLNLAERHGFIMLYPSYIDGTRDFILKVPTPEQRQAIELCNLK